MTTPISSQVDFDRIVTRVLREVIGVAMRNWMTGRPLDEVALMNHLTGSLSRNWRCDVGVTSKVVVDTTLALLHRRGHHQTDQYGSDLAVTVTMGNPQFVKTAFFQLKRSSNYHVELRRDQILAASGDDRIRDRSFAFAADDVRGGVRIHPISNLISELGDRQTKNIDCSSWLGLAQWVLGWLSCNIGLFSDQPFSPDSVENLIGRYVLDPPEDTFSWFGDGAPADFPDDGYPPARIWMIHKFTVEEDSQS